MLVKFITVQNAQVQGGREPKTKKKKKLKVGVRWLCRLTCEVVFVHVLLLIDPQLSPDEF